MQETKHAFTISELFEYLRRKKNYYSIILSKLIVEASTDIPTMAVSVKKWLSFFI